MLKNVFLKSLYEKRWSTLGWVIAIIAMTALSTLFFPTFKESFGQSLQEVPESMKAFFGDASTYQTLAGFVDVQVVAQMVFLTIIMAVIVGSGFIAGDEGDGTLQSLLAQPIKRASVYVQKYFALVVLTVLASSMVFIAVFISAQIINETMDWWRMAQATCGVWLITFVFGVAAYSLGAITGKRALSGSIVGMLAFVTYIITSLAVGVDALKTVDKISPFHYFNTPSIIANGIDWGNVAVLASIITIFSVIGFVRFIKRDIR
jgi:ABC-2 type transport system permease protein